MKQTICIILTALLLVGVIYFGCTPAGVATWNNWWHGVQKVDDVTNYETRKDVEDSCRAMIASYEADKLTWEQYKNSEGKEQRSWAD